MEHWNPGQEGLQERLGSTYPQEYGVDSGFDRVSLAEDLSALVHDARNMVSALSLYCDLLEEPGVLTVGFRHYAGELRLVGRASGRLLDKLAAVECARKLKHVSVSTFPGKISDQKATWFAEAAEPLSRGPSRSLPSIADSVESLAGELIANRNLLSALVGPAITVGFSHSAGERPIGMRRDDLTRVLVNLAKNAAEAMPAGGHLQISLEESQECLSVSFTDNGPGIPQAALESIFSPGYSTHISRGQSAEHGADPALTPGIDTPIPRAVRSNANPDPCQWPIRHRGLGLSIVRSIVSAAGGAVWAANRSPNPRVRADSPSASDVESSQRVGDSVGGDEAVQGAVITLEFPLPRRLTLARSEAEALESGQIP